MRFLPLFFDTSAGVFILVGSGEPALAKLRLLRAAGAHVRWFSCNVDVAEELATSPGQGQLEISFGDPLKADLSDVVAIVSAAGELLDRQIAARARRQRIPVNVVDCPICAPSFFPPSSIAARWWSRSGPAALRRF
jgi:uroporphyrin-III C-methyltransferase/precorrin-2 dehydrogenase/sirohydrochlorin ferrochelatase